ncbi:hypothetical protein DERP_004701 [Dermatophagoides pteronyssinus]|uniref:Calponin-homology (CH) domain-containing protein n=1 Tax=Dermatophagoides pteronyssinus TaxID=6956 RepID=A0ABQ8JPI1_DERPT|nr:hypothetical protein DERP_004701 [Dermatophagoides pteronyssinus]
MAHYGIQAAVTAKTASKRSPNVEQALLSWIFENIGEKVPEGIAYEEILKDGVVLCKLMNKIKPGAIDKFASGGSAYILMENINKFLKAAQDYGVPHDQLFRTVDLFERKNIPEVTAGIISLARVACNNPDYKGTQLEKWINAFEDLNNDELSTFCIIGQLFKSSSSIDIPIGQRLGNCVCRDSNHCKRSIKTDNNMQLPQSDHLSNLVNYQTNSNLKLIISISMAMAIIGFLSFIIYYYGIRYGMIQYYARRLGLINNRQNSNIEDNQLLNHISSTTTTTTTNHDDIELTL